MHVPHRKRTKTIGPSSEIKLDFLIPIVQDSTKRPHPHTAYEEWHRLLFVNHIHLPTRYSGRDKGHEEQGMAAEESVHWYVFIPKRKLQRLLRLLRDDATRIFDQRWILAWEEKVKPYKLGETKKTK